MAGLAAAAAACGVISAGLTAAAMRRVGMAASLVALAWAGGAAAFWVCAAVRTGVLMALPLIPVAVVAAPLAVTDWTERRLPDVLTLPAGSATAAAMAVATAAESSSAGIWLAAGPAAGLALAGHTLAARGAIPVWCAAVSVWAATTGCCVIAGAGRLTATVAAGAVTSGVILVGHLGGLAGFGDVKIMPVVCCAAWAAWDPVGGFWPSAAASLAALWLSLLAGGLVTTVSERVEAKGVPLGAFVPGSAVAVAVAVTWL